MQWGWGGEKDSGGQKGKEGGKGSQVRCTNAFVFFRAGPLKVLATEIPGEKNTAGKKKASRQVPSLDFVLSPIPRPQPPPTKKEEEKGKDSGKGGGKGGEKKNEMLVGNFFRIYLQFFYILPSVQDGRKREKKLWRGGRGGKGGRREEKERTVPLKRFPQTLPFATLFSRTLPPTDLVQVWQENVGEKE